MLSCTLRDQLHKARPQAEQRRAGLPAGQTCCMLCRLPTRGLRSVSRTCTWALQVAALVKNIGEEGPWDDMRYGGSLVRVAAGMRPGAAAALFPTRPQEVDRLTGAAAAASFVPDPTSRLDKLKPMAEGDKCGGKPMAGARLPKRLRIRNSIDNLDDDGGLLLQCLMSCENVVCELQLGHASSTCAARRAPMCSTPRRRVASLGAAAGAATGAATPPGPAPGGQPGTLYVFGGFREANDHARTKHAVRISMLLMLVASG